MTLKYRIAAIIGHLLEQYDRALFGLLAPFISPLFFKNQDPITSLIFTFGMIPLGYLARPLGAWFFGWIGDHVGRKEALFGSLLGLALITFTIGFLPTYEIAKGFSPILLAICRILQGFFAAGESSGGAIFILENSSTNQRSTLSGWYNASSMGGILIASAMVTFFASQGWIEKYWRTLFFLGGMTGLFGVFIRRLPTVKTGKRVTSNLVILVEEKKALLRIIFASGFSHATYYFAFTLMNGLIPLLTPVSKAEIMSINTLLLILDFSFLPIFGFLANKFGNEKIMLMGSIGAFLLACPLFYFLNEANLITISALRCIILILGVAFAAPYHAWAIQLVKEEKRYLIMSIGSAIGAQIIGAPCAAISIFLFQLTGSTYGAGFYFALSALAASWSLFKAEKIQEHNNLKSRL